VEAQPVAVGDPPLQVREIGSIHVGGRLATISDLPEREVTLLPGAPPMRLSPNGEFWVEQMYAQYIRLANPARAIRC